MIMIMINIAGSVEIEKERTDRNLERISKTVLFQCAVSVRFQTYTHFGF